MPELVCDTSPLQYLHQLRQLDLLRELASKVLVPPAVALELTAGINAGCDLPILDALHWIEQTPPVATPQIRGDLGRGELEVLSLVTGRRGTVAVLDDNVARRVAERLQIPFTGTLGILLDAKRLGLIEHVSPLIDRLSQLHFRVSPATRTLILRAAGEA